MCRYFYVLRTVYMYVCVFIECLYECVLRARMCMCVGECVFVYVGINVYVGMRVSFCVTTPTYTCAILLSVP